MSRRSQILSSLDAHPTESSAQIAKASGAHPGYVAELRSVATGHHSQSRLLPRIQEETGLNPLQVIFTLWKTASRICAARAVTHLLKTGRIVLPTNLRYYVLVNRADFERFKPSPEFLSTLREKLDPRDRNILDER